MGDISMKGVLGTLSPAFGAASGHGLFGSPAGQAILGTLSPAYGLASGDGLFGSLFGKKKNPDGSTSPTSPTPAPTSSPSPVSADQAMARLPAPPQQSSAFLEGLFRDLGITNG